MGMMEIHSKIRAKRANKQAKLRELVICMIIVLGVMVISARAHAGVFAEDDTLRVMVGPQSYHFHHRPVYNNEIWMMGLEWESGSQWEIGASRFKNSYHQQSHYIYGGKRFIFGDDPNNGMFFNITAGALIGYRRPFDRKIPVNDNHGIGLGIIPSIGYKYKRVNAQLIMLGTSAVMGTVGIDIWK